MARANARAGPVTGPLERPSQQPLEIRKAKKRKDTKRGMRAALRAVHTAERQLLRTAHRYDVAQASAAIAARGAQARSAGTAAIAARFAERLAGLSPGLSKAARAAAMARLRDEEAAEIAVFQARLAAETRVERRVVMGGMRLQQRGQMTALGQRHRRERLGAMVAGMAFGGRQRTAAVFVVDRRVVLALRSRKVSVQRKRPRSQRRRRTVKVPKGS